MKIGVIGSGKIGSTVGRLWASAGHHVLFSSRHPEDLAPLIAHMGPNASSGTIDEAAADSEVVFLAVPFGALHSLSLRIGPVVRGKVVIDASNPYPQRDGHAAVQVLQSGKGTGAALRALFPESFVVRAFNTVWDRTLASEAHRQAPQVGIPLAADNHRAMEVAAQLVRDAGFDPVEVGDLEAAVRFDAGSAVYNTGMTAGEIRRTLRL